MTVSHAGISRGGGGMESRELRCQPSPASALSIPGDICLLPSISVVKHMQPAAGRTSRLGTGGDSPS